MNKKRHQKNLGKKCPECEEGYLYSIFKTVDHDGAEYGDEYIECEDCGYSKKISNKKNKIKLME
jgi:uncharacterized protein (DUF983 family)